MSLHFAARSLTRSATRSRSLAAASLARFLPRDSSRPASTATVPTSSSKDTSGLNVRRDATVSHPDPAADSSTAALVDSFSPYLVATYVRPPPVIEKGEGSYVWDVENRRYLDFTAGISVVSLGHCDPEMTRLLAQHGATLVHCSNLYHNPWTGELARLLISKTRESGGMADAARLFVCNSGTEANEAAIKFARKVGSMRDSSGDKHEIVSFHGCFHGRTMGALSATPNPKYQKPFSPMLPGFKYAPFNDLSRIDEFVTERTAGVIVEPIQGEGGINVATPEFLQALRDRCIAVGAVLIYDEIQCGLGRTGKLWAHSWLPSSAHPDIVTTAKALGNGFPIGATMVSEEVAECVVTGDHGTTFGGNPLACRIAHYCTSRLAEPELQSDVIRKGEIFRAGFDRLRAKFPELIRETRGKGLILGLQLTQDPTPIITAARERGLLIITAGTNTLRFLPPFVVTEEQIEEGLTILEQAIEATSNPASSISGTKGQQEMAPPGR